MHLLFHWWLDVELMYKSSNSHLKIWATQTRTLSSYSSNQSSPMIQRRTHSRVCSIRYSNAWPSSASQQSWRWEIKQLRSSTCNSRWIKPDSIAFQKKYSTWHWLNYSLRGLREAIWFRASMWRSISSIKLLMAWEDEQSEKVMIIQQSCFGPCRSMNSQSSILITNICLVESKIC